MLIGHFTEQPWQDDQSGLMGTQSTDLSISNEYYNPQVGSIRHKQTEPTGVSCPPASRKRRARHSSNK